MRLRCVKNSAESKVFTDGKVYEEVCRQGNLVGIRDDFGDLRYVLPNEPSPHLVQRIPDTNLYYLPGSQRVVGRFEEVA